MKFKNYLNESYSNISDITSYELNKLINKDCKYYLKLIKDTTPLYRGMDIPIKIGKKDVRQDRESLGMDQDVADALNVWLKDNNHTVRNKSVIATGDLKHTQMFGAKSYFIFPMGKFNYTWIKTKDINISDDRNWNTFLLTGMFGDDMYDMRIAQRKYGTKEDMEKIFTTFITTNKGFDIAQRNGYGIWMDCKSYYFVDVDSYYWLEREQEFTGFA